MSIFNFDDPSEIKAAREDIVDTVRRKGFSTIRGMFVREEIREAMAAVYDYVNSASHKPSAGVSPEEIRVNMTKWSIGGHSQSQAGLPRFMLTLYNPMWQDDTWRLRNIFRRVIAIRDALAGRDIQSDESLAPDRYNGCRVQIYPSGGGFMGAHVDSRAISNLPDGSRAAYIQMVLLLTERGTDYHHGGAFATVDGKIVDSEADALSGDVLVYDGNTNHGVADIDPTVTFNANNLRGRAVALATIYTQ
ncbi:hypothetical protein [Paraburkholderia sp. BCC1885]|uniref:hypothetical protein n=1 Tax=Paraburkholderia sp. BCC1885 TaxID=2562669 RepID=UPI001183A6FE|nr:hypothetical protein [Paraburkholderia sp. BCC1885]